MYVCSQKIMKVKFHSEFSLNRLFFDINYTVTNCLTDLLWRQLKTTSHLAKAACAHARVCVYVGVLPSFSQSHDLTHLGPVSFLQKTI